MSDAFTLIKDGKKLDYRIGNDLDIQALQKELTDHGYSNINISKSHRHYTGSVQNNNLKYFIKISTFEGMNETTKNELVGMKLFTENLAAASFSISKIITSGLLLEKYFYYIAEWIDGKLLVDFPKTRATKNLSTYPQNLVDIALCIEKLPLPQTPHVDRCIEKVSAWYDAIPESVVSDYKLTELLEFVKNNISTTASSPRHGDFAPWHLFITGNKLTLFDFEHFLPSYIAHYDIAFMAQRIWGELGAAETAKAFLDLVKKNGVKSADLRVPLSMRAIGGFLDASLGEKDYTHHATFADYIKSNF